MCYKGLEVGLKEFRLLRVIRASDSVFRAFRTFYTIGLSRLGLAVTCHNLLPILCGGLTMSLGLALNYLL